MTLQVWYPRSCHADCPHNDENDNKSNKDKEGKKMTFKKKKGHAYCVEWDSDTSSDCDDDDQKSTKKKALASIAVNNKPSIFDTPSSCFMPKGPKVQDDESASGS